MKIENTRVIIFDQRLYLFNLMLEAARLKGIGIGLATTGLVCAKVGIHSLLSIAYSSLEWALLSPSKPHAFQALPLQSLYGKVVILRYLSGLI